MSHESPSDAELLAAAGRGDRGAFGTFVERHAPGLWRFVRAHRSNPTDAEDLVQQTFVAAWRGAAGARVERGARPWLFTIARHALVREAGRARRRADHEASLEELGEAAGFACDEVTAEVLAEHAEERELLREALADLSPDERQVVLLRDVEGWSGAETAEALGLTLAAQKSRLHRARLRLAAAVRRRIPAPPRTGADR